MDSTPQGDLTPISGSETDVARLGSTTPPPPHERTASNDGDPVNWEAIAASPEFRGLLKRKAAFIIPATIFFTVYYFLLPIAVGWFPKFMEQKVFGDANLAYVFAFSQFIMAWIMAGIYVKTASGWDLSAKAIVDRFVAKR